MASYNLTPSSFKGTILSQPSKSMAHRAVICGSLAKGESTIENIVLSEDIKATLRTMSAMGFSYTLKESCLYPGRHQVVIQSSGSPRMVEEEMDCGESGSTARFIMPITRLDIKKVTTCRELNRLGAKIEELPDGLVIRGVEAFSGGEAEGCGDHRIVMALAVAASVGKGEVLLHGCEAVAKSYPEFWEDYESLGGKRADA